jgi:hypothetical protein
MGLFNRKVTGVPVETTDELERFQKADSMLRNNA